MAQASKGGSTAVVPLYLVKAYYFASFCYFATYVRYATLYFEAEAAGYTIYTMCWTSPRRFSPSASASARAQFHLRPPDSPLVVFACKLGMSTRAALASLYFMSSARPPAACHLRLELLSATTSHVYAPCTTPTTASVSAYEVQCRFTSACALLASHYFVSPARLPAACSPCVESLSATTCR